MKFNLPQPHKTKDFIIPNVLNSAKYSSNFTSAMLKIFIISSSKVKDLADDGETNHFSRTVLIEIKSLINIYKVYSDENIYRENFCEKLSKDLKQSSICATAGTDKRYSIGYVNIYEACVHFDGKLYLMFTPTVYRWIKDDKTFTSYEIEELNLLKDKNSIRLFFILKQYYNANYNKKGFFIEELLNQMGFDEKSSYFNNFGKFNAQVLKKCLENIASSDLYIVVEKNIEKVKENGKVKKLIFTFHKKNTKEYEKCKMRDYGIRINKKQIKEETNLEDVEKVELKNNLPMKEEDKILYLIRNIEKISNNDLLHVKRYCFSKPGIPQETLYKIQLEFKKRNINGGV